MTLIGFLLCKLGNLLATGLLITGIADFFLCVKNPSLREVKKLA